MKKRLIIIMFLFVFMFIPKINAEDKISITCPQSVNTGDTFKCSVITTEVVKINTDLTVYKGSTLMSNSGDIEFKANTAKDYDIRVTDSSGVNTYQTVTVSVKEKTTTTTKSKSSNNYLKSISVNGNEITSFSKEKSKYEITVPYETESIVVNAETEDDLSEVTIDEPTNITDTNEYTITVTAEDKTTKIYKVIVKKEEKKESDDTSILSIKIKGYNFNYDGKSKTSYLTIKNNVKKLNIDVITNDDSATYKIKDNKNLEDGSVITITVTAENKDTTDYRIIIRKKEVKSNLPIFIGIGVIIFLIIIIVVVASIVKKNKSNKNKDNKEIKKKKSRFFEEDDEDESSDIDEKTKEYKDLQNVSNYDIDDVDIDNDEEEKTRIANYEDLEEELGKTQIININFDEENED